MPVVVAKCGVYLKDKGAHPRPLSGLRWATDSLSPPATDVEGIFRLAGSEKRIKELKVLFDSPDRYGKGLDWTGFTVHDAANILRRYFNQLPEPIIPLDFYDRFRDPLRNYQAQAVGQQDEQDAQIPSDGDWDADATIRGYQNLITELPPLHRQLLLYILDLLAVFASKSDLNKMTTPNLAAIFQPGILSHPQHDMAPQEYRLSQDVLIFLIENQDNFLIGMQGTEADAQTVKEVQSGAPTPARTPTTPTSVSRARMLVRRSGSNGSAGDGSAGADSVRKFGSVRRHASVTSKNSKVSEAGPPPVSPSVNSPGTPTAGGMGRSNTVPSRRTGSDALGTAKFARDKTEATSPDPSKDHVTRGPAAAAAAGPSAASGPGASQVTSPSSSKVTTPVAPVRGDITSSAGPHDTQTSKDTSPLLTTSGETVRERSSSGMTPSVTSKSGFLDIFKQSPGSEDGRKPNKLQKKRMPGSALSSAHSSNQSLDYTEQPRTPVAATAPVIPPPSADTTAASAAPGTGVATHAVPADDGTDTPRSPPRRPTDAVPSPSQSLTDASDADMVGDDLPTEPRASSGAHEKKRHRWRFSRSQNKLESSSSAAAPAMPCSSKENTVSRSTVGSSTTGPSSGRKGSLDTPTHTMSGDPASSSEAPNSPRQSAANTSVDPVFSDSERERRGGGPMSWIRGKIQERRERDANAQAHRDDKQQQRSATPDRLKKCPGNKSEATAPASRTPTAASSQAGTVGESDVAPAPSSSNGVGERAVVGAEASPAVDGKAESEAPAVVEQPSSAPVEGGGVEGETAARSG